MGSMMRRTNDDPAGLYARLGVSPAASPAAITAAFHRKARVLHPDVVGTGNAAAFIWVKEAYDVLDDAERRAAYDRAARAAAMPAPMTARTPPPATRGPRLNDLPVALWAVFGGLFCLASIMAVVQFARPSPPASPAIARAFAPSAPAPRTPPTAPMRAAPAAPGAAPGTATHFVLPAGGAARLWRYDAARDGYLPGGQLADFTPVRWLRLVPQHGLVEIRLADGDSGFVDAARLAPGDGAAARRSYCTHSAGPAPENGAVLDRQGTGEAHLRIDNHASQPAVARLRDAAGAIAVSVFLAPGGSATVTGLPDVSYRPEFAVGELWSRACNRFSAGMRAQRFADYAMPAALSPLAVPPVPSDAPPPEDIPDAAFEHE
jgi:curved DNA-binding protein CbpA